MGMRLALYRRKTTIHYAHQPEAKDGEFPPWQRVMEGGDRAELQSGTGLARDASRSVL